MIEHGKSIIYWDPQELEAFDSIEEKPKKNLPTIYFQWACKKCFFKDVPAAIKRLPNRTVWCMKCWKIYEAYLNNSLAFAFEENHSEKCWFCKCIYYPIEYFFSWEQPYPKEFYLDWEQPKERIAPEFYLDWVQTVEEPEDDDEVSYLQW